MAELNFENVEQGVSGVATKCCLRLRDSARPNIFNVCKNSSSNAIESGTAFNATNQPHEVDARSANGVLGARGRTQRVRAARARM